MRVPDVEVAAVDSPVGVEIPLAPCRRVRELVPVPDIECALIHPGNSSNLDMVRKTSQGDIRGSDEVAGIEPMNAEGLTIVTAVREFISANAMGL